MAYFIDQTTNPGAFSALSVEPKLDQEGNQKKTKDGTPQWSIQMLHNPAAGKAEVINVTVPSHSRPEVIPMQPVVLDGLRVDIWQSGNSAGLWFAADGIL